MGLTSKDRGVLLDGLMAGSKCPVLSRVFLMLLPTPFFAYSGTGSARWHRRRSDAGSLVPSNCGAWSGNTIRFDSAFIVTCNMFFFLQQCMIMIGVGNTVGEGG